MWMKTIKKNIIQDLVEEKRPLCCKQETLAQKTGFQCIQTSLMPFYLDIALGKSFPILSSLYDRKIMSRTVKGLKFNLLTQQAATVLWILAEDSGPKTKVSLLHRNSSSQSIIIFLLFPQALIHPGQYDKGSVIKQGQVMPAYAVC